MRYGEGVFVGYRWYDARELGVDFPFGHGLGYTTFRYDTLDVQPGSGETAFTAHITVTNTGPRSGSEVVQLYVSEQTCVLTPPLELRAFGRVTLDPGESTTLDLAVPRWRLAHFSPAQNAWVQEGGLTTVLVGASSRDIRLRAECEVPGVRRPVPLSLWSTLREWQQHRVAGPRLQELIEAGGGVKGRMGDLLGDEASRASVLDQPLASLVEFPGFPVSQDQAEEILAGLDD